MTTRYGFGNHLVHSTALAMVMGVTLGVGYAVQAASAATAGKTPSVTKTIINNLPKKAIFRLHACQNHIYAFEYGPDHDTATLDDYAAGGSVYAYDPAANRWQARAKMPVKKSTYRTAEVNGKIYFIGGFTAPNTPSGSLEVYDPMNDTWTIKKSMPTPRCRVGVAVLDGKIYALGGRIKDTETDAVEVYEPITDTWSAKAKLPQKLMGVQAVAVKHKIFQLKGVNLASTGWEVDYESHEYDPATDTWTKAAPWPFEKEPEELVVVNDRLFVVGGGAFTDSDVHSLKEYDFAARQWVFRSKIPAGSMHTMHFSWAVLNGKIYTFGGGGRVGGGWKASNQALRYDPDSDRWEVLEPLSEGKIGMDAIAIGDRIFVMGGERMGAPDCSGQNRYSDQIEVYEIRTRPYP